MAEEEEKQVEEVEVEDVEVEDVTPESSPDKVNVSEDEKTPPSEPEKKPEEKAKTVPYDRFKEVNDELARLRKKPPVAKPALDVEDYIDISASLEGLDQREKEYLAREHKLTGEALTEIRKSEDFQLWDSAYKQKVEKELAVRPSGTQPESDKPKTLEERLREAPTLADKEKILNERGLYKSPRQRTDRSDIGGLKS